jgi:hypothetical protein
MKGFKVGDLVRVKRSTDLSPILRFFHNKIGMVTSLIAESQKNGRVYMREYAVLFSDGKRASFKDYELVLVADLND